MRPGPGGDRYDVNLADIGENCAGASKARVIGLYCQRKWNWGRDCVLNGHHSRKKLVAGESGYIAAARNDPIFGGIAVNPVLRGLIGGEGIKPQWQSLWRGGSGKVQQDLTARRYSDQDARRRFLWQRPYGSNPHTCCPWPYTTSTSCLNCRYLYWGGVGVILPYACHPKYLQQELRTQPTNNA